MNKGEYCLTEIEFLKSRGVTELIHFTPATNLPSILANGIIPRKRFEQEGVEFTYVDENRLDGKAFEKRGLRGDVVASQ